ncbi:MAG TPA: HAMP domain-containing histidine kinase [Candidatus Ornithospirochaeta stercorigallinarum]|nr:HAMP domain-containing histidine kinase [Candidatus Ornithospirochaeta stercorigallinarum]
MRKKRAGILDFLEKKSSKFSFLIEILISLCFLSVFALMLVLSVTFVSVAELELENSTERAFNAVLMAFRDSDSPIESVMAEYSINGVGIYSASGNLLYSAGSVYPRLPVNLFSSMESNKGTSSLLSFDSRSNVVEYLRASSQAVIPTTESILLPIRNISLSYPNIIYLSIDASSYSDELVRLRILSLVLLLVTLLVYILVLYVYRQNKKYKALLVRQESLVSLGEAARTLTHEIKNPLSAITIQIALLKRTVAKENMEDLYTIEHETKRLIELTDKVSDFLRKPLGEPKRIDAVKEIKELFPLFKDEIIYEPESLESVFTEFDPNRFRSVFENLIKNAIEATREGDVPEVSISIRRVRKGKFEIAVKDRGVGIDAKDQKKIFDPFFTTKIHGSGIGLSISMQFVKAVGGELVLKRRSGGGTAAIVTLKEA